MRQFIANAQGWCEKLVGLDGENLVWGLSQPVPEADKAVEGAWRERSAMADGLAAGIAARIARDGGAALIVDYGYGAADRPP